jgi:hypothetical protein
VENLATKISGTIHWQEPNLEDYRISSQVQLLLVLKNLNLIMKLNLPAQSLSNNLLNINNFSRIGANQMMKNYVT